MTLNPPPPESRHVLVVDDDDLVRYVLHRYLNAAGYQVSVADNGGRALEICASSHVDVLITDQQMPRMTGASLIAHVHARYPATRCILVSAIPVNPSVFGANVKWLTKPIAKETLLREVGGQ